MPLRPCCRKLRQTGEPSPCGNGQIVCQLTSSLAVGRGLRGASASHNQGVGSGFSWCQRNQQQAAWYWTNQETTREIELRGANGEKEFLQIYGEFNTINHQQITQHILQYWQSRNQGENHQAKPPTPMEELPLTTQQDLWYNELSSIESQWVTALTSTHGVYPSMKADGIWWIIFKNLNGLQPWLDKNNKLIKLCDMIDKLQADVVGLCKNRINFAHASVVSGPRQMFQQEATIQSTAGHNIHKNVGWYKKEEQWY